MSPKHLEGLTLLKRENYTINQTCKPRLAVDSNGHGNKVNIIYSLTKNLFHKASFTVVLENKNNNIGNYHPASVGNILYQQIKAATTIKKIDVRSPTRIANEVISEVEY